MINTISSSVILQRHFGPIDNYICLAVPGKLYYGHCFINVELSNEEKAKIFRKWLCNNVNKGCYAELCFEALRAKSELYIELAPYLIELADFAGYDLGLSESVVTIAHVGLNCNHRM